MEELDNLGQNKRDRITSALRGGVGAVPVVGSLIAELITNLVPNQRTDRIVSFLGALNKRIELLDREVVEARAKSEEFVDLFEDGTIQAARSLSGERRGQIASFLANALTDEDLEHAQHKRLLQLLGELNDTEIVILKSYQIGVEERDQFVRRHLETVVGPRAHMGSGAAEADKAAVHKSYRKHLVDLGLLKQRFKRPRKGELPEFDEDTGMMKAQSHRITRLGDLLVRHIESKVSDQEET